jgi:hypothetical protein
MTPLAKVYEAGKQFKTFNPLTGGEILVQRGADRIIYVASQTNATLVFPVRKI